jgi:hypothetical protein
MQPKELMVAVLAPLPPSMLSMRNLVILSGQPAWRVRRYLLSKRVIRKSETREKHYVDIAVLIERAPGFWKTIQQRAAREIGIGRAA